jgi:hypothetical protein
MVPPAAQPKLRAITCCLAWGSADAREERMSVVRLGDSGRHGPVFHLRIRVRRQTGAPNLAIVGHPDLDGSFPSPADPHGAESPEVAVTAWAGHKRSDRRQCQIPLISLVLIIAAREIRLDSADKIN